MIRKLHCILCLLFLLIFTVCINAAELHLRLNVYTESYYINKIHALVGGTKEARLEDGTRADILTDSEVIEVEFASKWYESIGQSLHYCLQTNRQPIIYLIVESSHNDVFVQRCKTLCEHITLKVKDKIFIPQVKIYRTNEGRDRRMPRK